MLGIKIETTDNYIHLDFKVKPIQKCQRCQLCVLRENSIECLQTVLNLKNTSTLWNFYCPRIIKRPH